MAQRPKRMWPRRSSRPSRSMVDRPGDSIFASSSGGRWFEVSPVTGSSWRHLLKIDRRLGNYGKTSGFGYALRNDFAVRTEHDPDTVRGADVAFYSNARLPVRPRSRRSPDGRPGPRRRGLFAERTAARRSSRRSRVSSTSGCSMVWVVHPGAADGGRSIARDDPHSQVLLGTRTSSRTCRRLPGFRCPVADLFA